MMLGQVLVRWLHTSDIPQVLDIERQVFSTPMQWDVEDFNRCFNGRYCGLIAVLDSQPIAYLLAKRHRRRPVLVSVAVHPRFQRRKVATALFTELTRRYGTRQLYAFVPEDNLISQMWLRKLGCRAVKVHRGWYGRRDAYEFVWTRP